jgi:surfactin family lipopeptide synthetase A
MHLCRVLETVEPYVIDLLDVRHLSPEEQEVEIQRVRKAMSHHLFKVNVWPLFEVRCASL